MTTRHETLADAFLYASTSDIDTIIHHYHGDFYTVPFASMEWAFSCGMRIVDDFSPLFGGK